MSNGIAISSTLDMRNITIEGQIIAQNVEATFEHRRHLLRIFTPKQRGTLIYRDRQISCIVEEAGVSQGNLMDCVTDLCDAADVGIKTTFDPQTGQFAISTYWGANTSAVFSREFENIIEQIFTQSIIDYATFALVGGEPCI